MSERKPFLILLLLIFFIALLRVAWLGDDSYITMRSVVNWVNGYGLTWNPGECVQTFTGSLGFRVARPYMGCHAKSQRAIL